MRHCMRLNSGMTEPADFKKTAEFDVVRDSQVCVYARHADLFSFVSSIVYRAALCRARGNHNDGGFKTLCSCWESLERFFLLPLALSLFFFPFHIASFPCIFTPPPPSPLPKHTLFSSSYKCSLLKQLSCMSCCMCAYTRSHWCVCTWHKSTVVLQVGDFKLSKHRSNTNIILWICFSI